jgi:molecular chaperone DnaK (HSP70)
MILKHIKEIAQKRFPTPITEAVITVPAYFNTLQRDDTEEAARRAGLRILRLLDGPSAAAIAFGFHAIRDSSRLKNVLVFDFGGGTLDVSLLEIHGRNFHVIAKGSDPHLGGRDFDDRLINWALTMFQNKFGTDVGSNKRAMSKLRKACEETKIALTANQVTELFVDSLDGDNDFSEGITRSQFEGLCTDLFARCLVPVDRALAEGHKAKSDIDDIILVGGTSRIPKIHEQLTAHFSGKRPYEGVDPQEAVALGAALWAKKLKAAGSTTELEHLTFYDICPVSLGISLGGGAMDKLIMKSSTVPISAVRVYNVAHTDCSAICLDVYAGERGVARFCHKVATFSLFGIPPAEGGTHKIEVTFILTVEVKLEAKARLIGDSQVTNAIRVERNLNPYSASELRVHIQVAEDYRAEDEREADAGKRTFELEVLDGNLERFYENEGRGHLFKQYISEQTKRSLKQLVHERYLQSTASPLSWTDVNSTKQRVRDVLRPFFMKERGTFPPWLE